MLLAVAVTACSVAAGDTHKEGARPRKVVERPPAVFGIGLGIVTWTDPQGSTENFYEGTTSPGRILKVEILYPTLKSKAPAVVPLATPAYRFGPYPVIVFAHGFAVDPDTYRALLVSWVEAGYVVVAPFFPDTSLPAIEAQHGVDTELDIYNQPADVAFVVSQVVKAEEGSPSTRVGYLAGMMNPDRLILAGQSDGGDTIAALMYDRAYEATRASLAAKAGRGCPLVGSRVDEGRGPLHRSERPGTALARRAEPDRCLQRPGQQLEALQHGEGPEVVPGSRRCHPSRPVCRPQHGCSGR